ncbi:unnamed protein product [Gadus morhua 'NCC']
MPPQFTAQQKSGGNLFELQSTSSLTHRRMDFTSSSSSTPPPPPPPSPHTHTHTHTYTHTLLVHHRHWVRERKKERERKNYSRLWELNGALSFFGAVVVDVMGKFSLPFAALPSRPRLLLAGRVLGVCSAAPFAQGQ